MPHTLGRGKKVYPGDVRHGTRWATDEEKAVAKRALVEMGQQVNRIALIPAPDPNFRGHKIRVQESENPKWYRSFAAPYWRSKRSFQLKRARVVKALKRVSEKGLVRRNGLERFLLEHLVKEYGTP
jgi:hypothetical protein